MAARPARILLLGKELSDFTGDIADCVRRAGARVDILEFRGLPADRRAHYDEEVRLPALAFNAYPRRVVASAAMSSAFLRQLVRSVTSQPAPRQITRSAKESLRGSLISRWAREAFKPYELINMHYLTQGALRLVPFVPASAKLVVSFWGDDLFHTPPRVAISQLPALERADVITVHSLEMKEVLLSKYGRAFGAKVRPALFGVSQGVVGRIDSADKRLATEHARRRYEIESQDIVIGVGYNASPRHNHGPIIDSLALLPEALKSKLVLLMPMTYGVPRRDYPDQIAKRASDAGLRAVIPREFLSLDEVAELRMCTDVMLLVPETDAMSSSLIECLWAGCVAVVASWLPYGLLRSKSVYFREVSGFDQIPEVLSAVVANLEAEKAKASENDLRLSFMRSSEQAKNWRKIYWDLLGLADIPA